LCLGCLALITFALVDVYIYKHFFLYSVSLSVDKFQTKLLFIIGESDGDGDDDDDPYWNQTVPDQEKTTIGVTDTVTAPEQIVENYSELLVDSLTEEPPPEFPNELSVAPGEGKKRTYINKDPEAPWTCFPTIFAGQSMAKFIKSQTNPSGKLYLSEFCKVLMRHVDSRFRDVPEAIFFFMKMLQEQRVFSKVNIACRKGERNGPQTADQAINWQKLCEDDKCYRFLKDVRFSPPYWAKFKSEVYAMVEQLGSPQWFLTISCAESHWFEVLAGVSGHSVAEVEKMNYQEKCDIVVRYPTELARIFQHRVNLFMQQMLPANKQGFLGEILNRVVRYEFQKRGSPHIHSLIWLTPPKSDTIGTTENADHYRTYKDVQIDWAKLDNEEGEKFFPEWAKQFHLEQNGKIAAEVFGTWIDRYVTCSTDCRCEPDSVRCFKNQQQQEPKGKIKWGCEIPINYQYHRHSPYCRREKAGSKYCRFGFPKPPMPETHLFLPLEYDYPTLAKFEEEISGLLKMSPDERPEDCNLEEMEASLKPLKEALQKRKKTAGTVASALSKWLNEFDHEKPEEKDITTAKYSGEARESFLSWLAFVIECTGLSDYFSSLNDQQKIQLYYDSIRVELEEPTIFIKRKLDAVTTFCFIYVFYVVKVI